MKPSDMPEMTCVRLETPLESRVNAAWLLGRLESALLVPVELASRDSGTPRPPHQRTIVGCAWTDTHLHIAFHCDDTDAWSTFSQRDDPLYGEEVVEVFLSPTGDLRHYFELELSPRNVLFDAAVHSPDLHRLTMTADTAWDCAGMTTSVETPFPVHSAPPDARVNRSNERGWWQGEFYIPFVGLGVESPRPGDAWRINFFRIDRPGAPASVEFSAWSPTGESPPNFQVPSRFGRLVFGSR